MMSKPTRIRKKFTPTHNVYGIKCKIGHGCSLYTEEDLIIPQEKYPELAKDESPYAKSSFFKRLWRKFWG